MQNLKLASAVSIWGKSIASLFWSYCKITVNHKHLWHKLTVMRHNLSYIRRGNCSVQSQFIPLPWEPGSLTSLRKKLRGGNTCWTCLFILTSNINTTWFQMLKNIQISGLKLLNKFTQRLNWLFHNCSALGRCTYQTWQDDHICIYCFGALLLQPQTLAGLPFLSQCLDPLIRCNYIPIKP